MKIAIIAHPNLPPTLTYKKNMYNKIEQSRLTADFETLIIHPQILQKIDVYSPIVYKSEHLTPFMFIIGMPHCDVSKYIPVQRASVLIKLKDEYKPVPNDFINLACPLLLYDWKIDNYEVIKAKNPVYTQRK